MGRSGRGGDAGWTVGMAMVLAGIAVACGTPKPSSGAATSVTTAATEFAMPNAVGGDLQAAQDAVQAAANDPLFLSISHDLSGQERSQVLDSNWKVCTQEPAAGATFTKDTKVDFGVVKLEEACVEEAPTTMAAPPPAAAEPAPTEPPPTPTEPPTTPAPTEPPTTFAPPTTMAPAASVYYPNCSAAKAAGAAPLHRGEPGYRSELDRDGDGVACET